MHLGVILAFTIFFMPVGSEIIESPKSVIAEVGDSVQFNFSCLASETDQSSCITVAHKGQIVNPAPSNSRIYWKNSISSWSAGTGKKLTRTLFLTNVSKADEGAVSFTCDTSVPVKKSETQTAYLSINDFKINMQVSVNNQVKTIEDAHVSKTGLSYFWTFDWNRHKMSSPVHLTIQCSFNPGYCTFTTLDVDTINTPVEALTVSENGSTYHINVNRSNFMSKFGDYRCVCYHSENTLFQSQTLKVGMSPLPPPPEKDDLIVARSRKGVISIPPMTSYAWGYPQASITWLKKLPNGKTVQVEPNERISFKANGTRLEISSASFKDNGMFLCVVQNTFASKSYVFEIKVIEKYEAVLPFFGLLVEVIFFAVAILLYERQSNKIVSDSSSASH